jgi:peptide/nickel transport system substrate-binding protein
VRLHTWRLSPWRAIAAGLWAAVCFATPALSEKAGGILRINTPDSPASMSIHEEATVFAQRPMMGVFNNLIMYDQHSKQASLSSILPDLATDWSWNEDGTVLTLPLRQGVKWHDGTPFTARDVKCTWDMIAGFSGDKLRINPRKTWYRNLAAVTTNGDYEVSFHLNWPQPAFLTTLASGFSPVYPCHVSPRDMRQHPIGTGPFKFAEYKANEYIRVTKNSDYWKPDRPLLDGIEYTVVRSPSTANLAFIAGKFDMSSPYGISIPLLKDIKQQAPKAICEVDSGGVNRNLLVNREKPPFDNPELRLAMALSLDRKAFIDIISDGQGDIGGVMQPLPEGLWGMPPELLKTLPGYAADVGESRAEARRIMQQLGYGQAHPLRVKVSTRDLPFFRDPAVILIDQLKEVHIGGELETIDSSIWLPKVMRKDYIVALNLSGSGPDPDQNLYSQYGCQGDLNYNGYCNPETDRLIERQSAESDQNRRKQLVWEIEKRLAADGARPIIFYNRGATCWQPYVQGLTIMVNSISSGWRMEDVWLDK